MENSGWKNENDMQSKQMLIIPNEGKRKRRKKEKEDQRRQKKI
jgi:hypothetical protein